MMKPQGNNNGGGGGEPLGKQGARSPPGAAVSMISSDKNLMPSMVVRQQRSQQQQQPRGPPVDACPRPDQTSNNNNNNNNNSNNHNYLNEQETPSTTTLELLKRTRQATADCENASAKGLARPQHSFDQNGLILPRRVPHTHPQLLLASEPGGGGGGGLQVNTIRDLNRELKFNQARGKNVLEQKSELKRAMEKLEASRRKKEAEQERLTRRSSLELRLEERAERLARNVAISGEPQASESSAAAAAATKSGVLS